MNLKTPAVPFAAADLRAVRADTRPVRSSSVIHQLLADVRFKLDARKDSNARRALLGKLESLQQSVARWQALPPSREQASAMLDMLLQLQESSEDEGRSFRVG